jgi:hypothetical protein
MRKLLFISLGLAACSGDKDLKTPAPCNPLGGAACITPWPSAIYEIDDTKTETKRRLAIPEGALPKNFDGIEINPELYADQDGYSYAAPAIIAFRACSRQARGIVSARAASLTSSDARTTPHSPGAAPAAPIAIETSAASSAPSSAAG